MSNELQEIKSFLSEDDVKRKLADNYIHMIIKLHPTVPKSQLIEHLNLVQLSGANPFKKQVYFTSYYSKKLGHSVGATVFSYRFFEDQANQTNQFKGCPCEVDVSDYFDPMTGENKKTLRATATASRDGREDVKFVAWYPEFVQTSFGGQPNAIWKDKPHTMLRKCAIAGALRSQFPETLGTFIIEEEYGEEQEIKAVNEIETESKIIEAEKISKKEEVIQERITNSKSRTEVIERIKQLSSAITTGFNPAQKVKWMNDTLLIDSFERLTKKNLDKLKEIVVKLETIKDKPILMPGDK